MRHYRSRALILCPVSCVVSRETAILFRFHGVLGTEVAWGRTAVRGFERAGSRSTRANMLSASRQEMVRPVKPRTAWERALGEEEHDGWGAGDGWGWKFSCEP